MKDQIHQVSLSLLPQEAINENHILKSLKAHKDLKEYDIKSYKIIRKSIDARKKPIKVNLGILVSDREPIDFDYQKKNYRPLPEDAPEIVIVGAGPAGLFAALRAIERGIKPIVIERGKDVDSRRLDIAEISRNEKIDPESNYCFGEGGAGAFSDGKLYTRSKKRGNIREILEILHQFGASEDILIHAHPHIGSDKLPGIIKNIRETIKACGGEVRFNCRMDDLLIKGNKIYGVKTGEGEEINGAVFLATGHSARDTFRMLNARGIKIEPKGLAIGVRLEHPQNLIDSIQYHQEEGRGKYLPAAEYSFVDQSENRGVYTFCMCPGGVIVPAINDKGQIVVNGMSASARSGKWANSGYVVELHPGDIKGFEEEGNLEMLKLQEFLEDKFSKESEGRLNAPAQRISDFLTGKTSKDLPSTSYAPGIHSSDFNLLFPTGISKRLKEGLNKIKKRCPEFITEKGILLGLESRTSSPVRIPRNPETLTHVELDDLYPVGEGAGYAGGIVSSALDGMNCVDAYYKKLTDKK